MEHFIYIFVCVCHVDAGDWAPVVGHISQLGCLGDPPALNLIVNNLICKI